jgi:hypothetical protein
LREAGLGLAEAMELQILEGIYESQGRLIVLSKDEDIAVGTTLSSGQKRILTPDAMVIKKGQQICIFDRFKGEISSVSSVDQNSIVIDSPLVSGYSLDETKVVLLRKISLHLDRTNGVIRRKVNSSPAQPLLESVASFDFQYDHDANLVRVVFVMEQNEEKKYETAMFPKNVALVPAF